MRAHNFGAGPCTLPDEVLAEARDEMLDFAGTGMSIVELSHRSAEYEQVHQETLRLTRSVSGAPDDFAVLFVQGGATLQFSMIPMNLLGADRRGGYVVSGAWGEKALANARPHGGVYAAWDGAADGYRSMPDPAAITVEEGSRYLHITTNETIGGIRMVEFPETDTPLVADMSSEYLARPIAWERYDLVYGGVQKNLAPSGMAVVFVRRSVLEEPAPDLGDYLRYGFHAESDSLGNTPPMFPIYIMGKVLARIESSGGVAALERRSAEKAEALYAAIDESDGFYRNPVNRRDRSHMNVVFRLPSPELEAQFVSEAPGSGLIGLKGHRSVGGLRASMYAALSMDSVGALVEFMDGFRRSAPV
ncbi:MAG TPA: 3-phosphoserine/phosphohydroxythreonine transaminase [Acidimicrobiia bacterium]|nr:3-phosphoserine/phosphohydroxythreonine transaminase [Acidimicrobiia bacterium]